MNNKRQLTELEAKIYEALQEAFQKLIEEKRKQGGTYESFPEKCSI